MKTIIILCLTTLAIITCSKVTDEELYKAASELSHEDSVELGLVIYWWDTIEGPHPPGNPAENPWIGDTIDRGEYPKPPPPPPTPPGGPGLIILLR